MGYEGTVNYTVPTPIMNNVIYIATSPNGSFAITADHELYAWGSNSLGSLDNTSNLSSIPDKIMDDVQSVAAGAGGHTLILKMNGELYGVGLNQYGSLGQGAGISTITDPVKILDNVQKIDTTSSNSAALTTDGTLYHWGYLGDTIIHYEPTKVMENIKDFTCGSSILLAVDTNNSLYGYGDSAYQGTLFSNYILYSPTKLMDNTFSLSAYTQVLFVDSNNNLFTWGRNAHGQLGNGSLDNSFTPVKVMEDIVSVETGADYSFAISKKGELYSWGYNEYGKLGNGIASTYTLTPTKIPVFDKSTSRIEFDNPELTLPLNTTTSITATVYNVNIPEAVWTSSNPGVVTVSQTGEITTVGLGKAYITMTTGDGTTNSCTIIVTETGISDPDPLPTTNYLYILLGVSDFIDLSIFTMPNGLEYTDFQTWSSSDNVIASVDDSGLVTGISPGITTITVQTPDGWTDLAQVKVIEKDADDPIKQLAIDLPAGASVNLIVADSLGENEVAGLIWTSSNTDVVTVNNDGLVTAVTSGYTTIKAETADGEWTAYIMVRVY